MQRAPMNMPYKVQLAFVAATTALLTLHLVAADRPISDGGYYNLERKIIRPPIQFKHELTPPGADKQREKIPGTRRFQLPSTTTSAAASTFNHLRRQASEFFTFNSAVSVAETAFALAGLGSVAMIAPTIWSEWTRTSADEAKVEGSGSDDVIGPFSSLMDLAESWGRAIGMSQCGEMAICDAHANFRSYGLVALPVILFFPGFTDTAGNPTSDWQEAALLGKSRLSTCHAKYKCFLNPLWIAKFALTTFVF